jgi:hypothetical protein
MDRVRDRYRSPRAIRDPDVDFGIRRLPSGREKMTDKEAQEWVRRDCEWLATKDGSKYISEQVGCPRCHGGGDRPDKACWLCEPVITTRKGRKRWRERASIILLTPTVAAIVAIWAGYPALGVGMALGNLIGTVVLEVVRP